MKSKSSIYKIIKSKFNIDLVLSNFEIFFLLNIEKNQIMKNKKNQKLNHIDETLIIGIIMGILDIFAVWTDIS